MDVRTEGGAASTQRRTGMGKDDLCGRAAPPPIDCTDGHRWCPHPRYSFAAGRLPDNRIPPNT